MEVGPTRTCELLVGLPDVTVLAVDDQRGQPIRVHVEQRVDRPRCSECDAGGVREGPSAGRAGRLAVLRASGPAGVAQAPLVLPEVGLFSGVVDRPRPADRCASPVDDRPGLPVGDRAGRSSWPHRERGRRRLRLRLAQGERRRDRLRHPLVDDRARIGQVTAVGLLKCSSPDRDRGAPRPGPPRSPMSPPASSLTSSPVGRRSGRAGGSPPGRRVPHARRAVGHAARANPFRWPPPATAATAATSSPPGRCSTASPYPSRPTCWRRVACPDSIANVGEKLRASPRSVEARASPRSVEASPMRRGDARDTTEVRPRVP